MLRLEDGADLGSLRWKRLSSPVDIHSNRATQALVVPRPRESGQFILVTPGKKDVFCYLSSFITAGS